MPTNTLMMRTILFILLFVAVTVNGPILCAQPLNFYYGTLHAHSSYSDGNRDSATSLASIPYHNYQYAKTAQNFHFLGISEHNHRAAGMERANYAKGLQQADSANQNGTFVAMYGMEWGVIGPPGGHVLVYGVNQLLGWDSINGQPNYDSYVAQQDYNTLFTRIARTPGAFACMAHPASSDYGNLYANPVNATYDSALVACAIRSGPAFSTDTTYTDPSTSSYEARYKDALKRGYHVGATLDHDNHYTTFGKMAASRTVVLATSLTRANIMDAIRKRRTQSSDDWNVRVTFTVSGAQLGSIITDTANPRIQVSVFDPDMEATSSISILYGIPGSGNNPTTLTSTTASTLNFTHTVALGANFYYYAVVTQQDGDKIITAPVWVTKSNVLPVNLTYFTANKTTQGVNCKWETAGEVNADYFELQRSTDALHFDVVARVQATNTRHIRQYTVLDDYQPQGTTYYRLKQVDTDGQINYANIIAIYPEPAALSIEAIPNPFSDWLSFTFAEVPAQDITTIWHNTLGTEVWRYQIAAADRREYALQVPKHLAPGLYVVTIQAGGIQQQVKLLKQ